MTELVSVNGVELAYHQCGDGEPFVLVHGWTGSSSGWRGVIEPLAESHRVITYDHRGHGDSTNTGDAATYTFAQLVADFADLVEELGLEPFHLLGHSMGGLVVMRYALTHPHRIRSLVLMNTGASPAAGSEGWVQPLIELVREGGTAAYYQAAKDYVGDAGPTGEDRRRDFKDDIDRVDPVAFMALGRELTAYESVLPRLAGLSMPTTVLVGENDVGLRPAAADLARTIPGAVLDVIPGAAHLPHHEQPQAWLASVDAHFARLTERAGAGA